MIAVCTQYVWAWVNFVHNLRCLLKNLRSQQKFYATAGPTGPDKYELCNGDGPKVTKPLENHRWQWCPEKIILPSHRWEKITIEQVYSR